MATNAYDSNGNLLGVYRLPYTIKNLVNALTPTQRANVIADLTSGTPPKWQQDGQAQQGAIFVCASVLKDFTLTGAPFTDMENAAITLFLLDNPTYLVTPSFDISINIAAYSADGS
jgi:hypothetical protein